MFETAINFKCSDCGKDIPESKVLYVFDIKKNIYDWVCAECAVKYDYDDYEDCYTRGKTEYVYGDEKYIEPYAANMDEHNVERCDSCGHLFDVIDCGHYTNDGRTICDNCYQQMGYDECDRCCIAYPQDMLIYDRETYRPLGGVVCLCEKCAER